MSLLAKSTTHIWIPLFISAGVLFSPSLYAFKVGLVLDKGGKDDKSFNSAAYQGATKAQKELGIEFKYVEAMDSNAIENLHRSFARKDFDLIIGIGFAQAEAVRKIAKQFPDKKFAIVDGEVKATNVRSLLFEEHEGSFLVGALAALKTHGNKVGFIGGMDIPLIRRFEMGYKAGAEKINPKEKLISNFIGVTGDAWNNPAKAKELALAQYNAGVDVIFVAAGASGSGVFDAAEEKKKFAIGVDSNQNWIKPGFILTSMLKRVDIAVYDTIKESKENHFRSGVFRFGLKDEGIDYAVDQYNEKLITPEMKNKVEALKSQIIKGQIQVPDYYKRSKK
ncbi:MAG: BMP family ABC transporter substrate-binding protein [Bdellovibrio sp. CG10_big_fil_rev_8_21_14_0_10_47_8]|nr:MAG: BMP family ABC transporter substrate-binding protein [Bdellovibrio sp. CG10_big_fil_rev_8_21_14_0_10_47_8]